VDEGLCICRGVGTKICGVARGGRIKKEMVTLWCTSKKSGKPCIWEKNTKAETHAKEVD